MKDIYGNVLDTCHVNVKAKPTPTPVDDWTFETGKLGLKVGESVELGFVLPEGMTFSYRLSKSGIVSVVYENSKNYLSVTGMSAGTCTIYLYSNSGGLADSCNITVTAGR